MVDLREMGKLRFDGVGWAGVRVGGKGMGGGEMAWLLSDKVISIK